MTLRLLSLVALSLAFVFPALGQYPTHPIKILPNAAAGTGPDIMARLLGVKLQEATGQPVVVESRPGANGNIAGEYVAQSAPDGYTLLLATDAQVTVNPHVYSRLRFDWIKDFTPVASLATEAFKLVVSNQVPATNVAEFVTYAKSLKQPLFYGSSGTGSQHHLTMEMLKERTGINLTHIPYKGGGSATAQALLAGEVQATIGGAAVDAHVKSGKLRALGITSPKRSQRYPDLPTIRETLPGFEMLAWYGLFAPSATPAEPIGRLRTELGRILAMADVQAKINTSGPEAWISTPEEFASTIRRDYERNGKLVKTLNIHLE